MIRSAWFRWSVYGVGLAACVWAMVVLADVSGFDARVGLCGMLAIAGAVLATWAMMRSRRMRYESIAMDACATNPGQVADRAMVGVRFTGRDFNGHEEIIGVEFIEASDVRAMAAKMIEKADEVERKNEAGHLA